MQQNFMLCDILEMLSELKEINSNDGMVHPYVKA